MGGSSDSVSTIVWRQYMANIITLRMDASSNLAHSTLSSREKPFNFLSIFAYG